MKITPFCLKVCTNRYCVSIRSASSRYREDKLHLCFIYIYVWFQWDILPVG